LTEIKAVITDYIGTLTNARRYSLETSRRKLHRILTEAGFQTPLDTFLTAYNKAHEKYRVVRYKKLREVTNAVWDSEALNALGYKTNAEDPRIKAALNVFFQDYVDTLELRPYAKTLLSNITENCKTRLNLKLHLHTRNLRKPQKTMHKPLLQHHSSVRGHGMAQAAQTHLPNRPAETAS
jgi:hypothetical protein